MFADDDPVGVQIEQTCFEWTAERFNLTKENNIYHLELYYTFK